MGTLNPHIVEWGVAGRPLPGQTASGDLHFVKECHTHAVVAVIDGLGHGEGAAAAARVAIAALEKRHGESAMALMQHCHEELRGTRGAVINLALFRPSDRSMTWLGVGNAEGFLLHQNTQIIPSQETLLVRPGVVGDRMPRLWASIVEVGYGDLLIFATDGVRPGFADNINLAEPPQQIAGRILNQHARDTDDALVLVARYIYQQDGSAGR